MKVVIVGGVAGGASAAARLRRLDETAEIVIYERSGYISYANCGLPYYLGGVITDKEELTLQTPESFFSRFRIVAKVNHEVVGINPTKKTVTVRNLLTGAEFVDGYDKLLLSPGAKAVKPNIPGIDAENIFTLRTVEDTLRIDEYLKSKKPKTAVVVGGGFVGLETAENLRHLGVEVTVVEAAPQVMSTLDSDMVPIVHETLVSNGIQLRLGSSVTAFENSNGKTVCTLSNGEKLSADTVLLCIGVMPDTALAEKAGLKTGIKNSIVVDDRMQTSVADIYAVGDAVAVTHYVAGGEALVSLAGPANKQGRIAADNIAGNDSKYNGAQGSSVLKLFNLTVASTGINERQARAAGQLYEKVVLMPASHASYYPGGKVMTLKVLFNRQKNQILGAQIVGEDGVDKRIDVIATAIRAGMKATDLAELELAYAPPYSSAKDPVNMAGFVIENLVTGKVKQFYYEDVAALQMQKEVFLLDTRTPAEYARGHAEGFVNIPVDELRERIAEIPKQKPVYVMCQSGVRSYIACRILTGRGYECYNFSGGYRFYSLNEKAIK